MTQADILKVMKKQPERWFRIQELADLTKVKAGNASRALTKLFKTNEVLRKYSKVQYWNITLWKYKD